MAAYIVAQVILIWLWLAISVHALGPLRRRMTLPDAHVLAALLAWAGIGWCLLVLLSWRWLPVSVLSLGWARETLENTQRAAALLAALAAGLGGWRARRLLLPPLPGAKVAPATPKAGGKKPKTKRRP